MDDVVNRFARELADAIAAAVAENPQVEACREKARAAGFEMKVTLEAVVGFVSRIADRGAAKVTRAGARACSRAGTFEVTANDRRFLRSLRIAADETAEAGRVRLTARPNADSKSTGRRARACRPFLFRSPCAGFRLACATARGRGCRRRRIAEVVVPDRLQVVVQLVDQRDAGRDVQLDDLRLGDVVEILDQRAQAVAVRGDEHALARA